MDGDRDRYGLWLLVTLPLTALSYCIWKLTSGGEAPFDIASINSVALIACSLLGLVGTAISIGASLRAVDWEWSRLRGARSGSLRPDLPARVRARSKVARSRR